jgi:dTDP-glucose pyrophosphorylase
MNVYRSDSYCIDSGSTLSEAVDLLEKNALGIVLVVDAEQRLLSTITDGDIRRAYLAKYELSTTLEELIKGHGHSTSAPQGTSPANLLETMNQQTLRHIPIVDNQKRVVDLAIFEELARTKLDDVSAVLMAGGFGKRLSPLTDNMPKPMLPLAGRPILDGILRHIKDVGISEVFMTTHYMPEVIADFFKDGSEYGVSVKYVNEKEPLGTAGSLALLPKAKNTMLVMNGDIVTKANLQFMCQYHKSHGAIMTVATIPYESKIPYGVVEIEDIYITQLREKPTTKHLVNAGIYLIEPEAFEYIKNDQHMDMTDLIELLLSKNKKITCWPIREYWRDIGKLEDYQHAQEEAKGTQQNT